MEGLRFACRGGCANCCEQTGYVYLTERDLAGAARFLGMTKQAFERTYVYRTRHLVRLRKPRCSQCHFLLEGRCSIHPVKPAQCRAYPFWPEIVESRREWKKAGKICPGIGEGPLIPAGTILRRVTAMRESYPEMYGI